MVRSKSESMIAIALSEQQIPFRYENLITIDDAKNQIYLGENLIATFETSDCPLDYQSINNKIKQFLK
ncbi:hypothetical protein SAMN02910413_0987 [Pseudobutyrivibrio sp. C4]|nr:hypothetical protein SAMN02910413_0987 [Pseudobutyrivibrio sp. C4]